MRKRHYIEDETEIDVTPMLDIGFVSVPTSEDL
jgi:biopolymer transport protein ExbD